MTRKSQPPPHTHYTVQCPACECVFGMCGIPCFIFCPACQIKLIFWQDPRVPN